ncbi:MAG: hypothetical protein KDD45_09710 [Bdellovibrionales bacterium]|nr:hypothetical protein [Bdellovibrionales bacterium]
MVKTIEEQQKEIDMIHSYITEKRRVESQCQEGEKIVVHVNKDGSYNKTVERIASSSSSNGGRQVPVNNRETRVAKRR